MRKRPTRSKAAVAALLAPSAVGILLFLVVPILVVVWLSFQTWDLIGDPRFAGLANYASLLGDPLFGNAVLVSLALVAIVVPAQTALGLIGALLLHRRLPGTGALRTVFLLPWVCAPLALGIVWQWILAPSGGALNAVLGTRVPWLAAPELALPSVAAVVIWSNTGYVALLFLAGLRTIPTHLTEAAELDGAGRAALFRHITLPLLRPTLGFVTVTGAIAAFQLFDQVYALTGGGPDHRTEVIALRLHSEAFRSFDLGRASAMAVALLLLIAAITVLQRFLLRRRTG